MPDHSIYSTAALAQVPRLLSRADGEPFSKTFGSFDRTFWAWKFTDFPGARFQESAFALAYLYTTEFSGNLYYRQPLLLARLEACLSNWCSLQYGDGSFDEAYPWEHSLAATSFSSFYVGEAILTARAFLAPELVKNVEQTLTKAGAWLVRNDELHGVLSNHLAVAAAALDVIGELTGEERFIVRRDFFLDRIFAKQSDEGWFEEYGGADPGYQSHGTFYLAVIWRRRRDDALLRSLKKANAFLSHCIHPDGSLGGEYGSRNTEFYFPAGFEELADECEYAAAIADFMREGITEHRSAGLSAMDAYNFLPLLNNYLFAHRCEQTRQAPPLKAAPLPCFEFKGRMAFPQAGLVFVGSSRYYAIVGLSKGGVVKAFARNPLQSNDRYAAPKIVGDVGYWGVLENGRAISSQGLVTSPFPGEDIDDAVTVSVAFSVVNQKVMNPILFMGFRMFSLLFGWNAAASYWMKNMLVKVLVSRKKSVPLRLDRQVVLGDTTVTISDKITAAGPVNLKRIEAAGKFSAIHMGSSRYFQLNDMDREFLGEHKSKIDIDALNAGNASVSERSWTFE